MQCVSQPGPFGEDDPFGMGNFLSNLLGSLGGISSQWDGAQQLAAAVATSGESEPNVDPLERIKIEQLCRVAELQIAGATGLELTRGGRPPEIVPLTRSQWSTDALVAYRPLFEQLSSSLSTMMQTQLDDLDPGEIAQLDELLPDIAPGMSGMDASAMFAGLSQLMGPMMLTMMAGSTVGQLATRSFGSYDLPIPRASDDRPLSIIAPNIDAFAADWSLPPDDIRLWVCLNELATTPSSAWPMCGPDSPRCSAPTPPRSAPIPSRSRGSSRRLTSRVVRWTRSSSCSATPSSPSAPCARRNRRRCCQRSTPSRR